MVDKNQDKTDIELAKFNLALPFLTRINDLLNEISYSYRRGEVDQMKWALRGLFREIASKLSDKERGYFENNLWAKLQSSKKRNEAFFYCEKIDLWLRDRIEERGLGIPSETDRRFFSGVR